MLGAEVRVMLEGWWSVLHQSTEYLIIGKLNKPIVAIIEVILLALSKLSIKLSTCILLYFFGISCNDINVL